MNSSLVNGISYFRLPVNIGFNCIVILMCVMVHTVLIVSNVMKSNQNSYLTDLQKISLTLL